MDVNKSLTHLVVFTYYRYNLFIKMFNAISVRHKICNEINQLNNGFPKQRRCKLRGLEPNSLPSVRYINVYGKYLKFNTLLPNGGTEMNYTKIIFVYLIERGLCKIVGENQDARIRLLNDNIYILILTFHISLHVIYILIYYTQYNIIKLS